MGDLQLDGEESGQEGSRRQSSVKLHSAQSAGQRAKAHPTILQTEHWLIGKHFILHYPQSQKYWARVGKRAQWYGQIPKGSQGIFSTENIMNRHTDTLSPHQPFWNGN